MISALSARDVRRARRRLWLAGFLAAALGALGGCGGSEVGDSAPASAAGAIQAGRDKSVQCLGCHGAVGMSENVAWPNLAGQSEDFLVKQLRDYRAGRRSDPWMSQMAVPLSDQDIDELAAWFSQLDGIGGDPSSREPAAATCSACHSAQAVAANPLWPSLTGQNERYLVKQLEDFRAGVRADPVMAPLAKAIADKDVARLAAHFSNR